MAKEKSLSESLRYIYEHKGIDTFLNEKVMYSILSDLIPRTSREINWVIDAINIGAIKPLLEAEKSNLDRKEAETKSRKIFEDNEINKSRINYLLNSFSYGLKWTDKIISFEEIKKNEQKSKQKSVNSNKNVKKNSEKSRQQNVLDEDFFDIKKYMTRNQSNNKNTKSDNKNKLSKDKLQRLEVEYNTLYSGIDKTIQSNSYYIASLSKRNLFIKGAVNIISILICLSIMMAYLSVLIEGYVYKRILILDIIGFILGGKVIINNFNNLKKIKANLSQKSIYNEYISLINNVHADKEKFNLGLVSSLDSYNGLNNRLKLYKDEYLNINNKWQKKLNNIKNKETKILKLLIGFLIVFIISGVYESRLIYDKDNLITLASQNIVENIAENVYETKKACIKADTANVRRIANKNSDVVAKVKCNDILYLTGKSYENKDGTIWYEVKNYYLSNEEDKVIFYETNSKCWISGSVIKVIPNRVTVSSSYANVRNKPSLNSKSVHIAKSGDILYTTGNTVVTSERTWIEVYLDGQDGYWISSNVLEED